jgi:hypothetical protein
MPFKIPLTFVPPDVENLVEMKIWEATAIDGAFNPIETVTDIGSYPTYIDNYTTDLATAPTDWFALTWVDDKGAETELTQAIQGGVQTLVAEITQRCLQRIPRASLQVVTQEVEGSIQVYMGETVDPYDPTLLEKTSYRQRNGLTYMTIARTLMGELLMTSAVQSAQMGLIQFKAANTTQLLKNIEELMEMAEADLGISGSRVLDMERILPLYGGQDWRILRRYLYNDQEFAFIPWQPWPIEPVKG